MGNLKAEILENYDRRLSSFNLLEEKPKPVCPFPLPLYYQRGSFIMECFFYRKGKTVMGFY
ncbi:MAG: hypothetical protein GDA46_00795 [Bdellovibrionales bacterium]|nr:hypothetical protein [Bdellovibrionales bacterium]